MPNTASYLESVFPKELNPQVGRDSFYNCYSLDHQNVGDLTLMAQRSEHFTNKPKSFIRRLHVVYGSGYVEKYIKCTILANC